MWRGGRCTHDRGRHDGRGALPRRCQHIVRRDPPSGAAAADAGQVDAVLAREAPHGRRYAAQQVGWVDRAAVARGHRLTAQLDFGRRRRRPNFVGDPGAFRRCDRLARRIGDCRSRRSDLVDHRDRRAGRDGLAFLGDDLSEDAADRRGDFGVDLVGRNLDERFVLLDAVADFLEPLRDGPLGDGLTELGHHDRRRHQNATISRIASIISAVEVMNSSSSVNA